MTILVAPTAEALAAVAAETVGNLVGEAGRRFTIGLAGGGTPGAAYRRLRGAPVDWEKVVGWLGDERWVPPEHADSNGRMAAESLFDHVPATLLRVEYEGLEPAEAAARYERELKLVLSDAGPDLVLLGLGEDGHTASLFPGTSALAEQERLYVANWVARLGVWRVTATVPLLHSADRLVFLVAGRAKARAVAGLFEGDRPYPARLVMAGPAEVTWLLDEEAASLLTTTPRQAVEPGRA